MRSLALDASDVMPARTPHATDEGAPIVAEARLVIETRDSAGGLPLAPHVIRL